MKGGNQLHAFRLRFKITSEKHSLLVIVRIGAVPHGQTAFSEHPEAESEFFHASVLPPEIGVEHIEPCVRDQPLLFFQTNLAGRGIITSAGMKITLGGLIHPAAGKHERL